MIPGTNNSGKIGDAPMRGLGWRFLGSNVRFLMSGGFALPRGHRLPPGHAVPADFFGICVASSSDAVCDDYVVGRLRELGILDVRLDYTYGAAGSGTERFLDRLLREGFRVCLHLVQPPDQARRMDMAGARAEWREFVDSTLGRYGGKLDLVEIGSTCNRRKWSGYSMGTFMETWRIAHRVAVSHGVRVAAPNVTDFEPVYNIGWLGVAQREGVLPAVHTDNLFAERATEPETYDHKILGRALAPFIKYNVVKKAALLRRITERYGVGRLMCGHVAWSERRIRRLLCNPWEKQADYLQRYLCLMAASGAFDRVYWGPMIGQREGIIDDGTNEYPDLPHVTFYGKVNGSVAGYRARPAFAALQTVVRMLAGARFIRDHSMSPHLRVLEFEKNQSRLHVVWTTNGNGFDPASWYDSATLAGARAISRDGRAVESFPCLVGESPVFLLWEAPVQPGSRGGSPRMLAHHRFHAAPDLVYRRVADGEWTGIVAIPAGQDPARRAQALLPDALERAESRSMLRDGRNRVWSCRLPSDPGVSIVVKRSQVRSWHRRLLDRYKPSRSLRSWNGACELLRRGVSTPRPLAFFERSFAPQAGVGYYVCEAFPSRGSVRNAFHEFARGGAEYSGVPKGMFYGELAAFIRHMHQHGVFFRDLSAGNILVRIGDGGAPEFSLVDTTRAVFFRQQASRACQLSDLKRICHRLTWPERRAFVGQYFGTGEAGLDVRTKVTFALYDAKHWIKQVVKRARRARRSA